MTLYTIAADPLARQIINNNEVKGITLGNFETKIQQYADDITATVQDVKSLDTVLSIFTLYEGATGQKLNKEKTEIYTEHKWTKHLLDSSIYKNQIRSQITVLEQKIERSDVKDTWTDTTNKIQRRLNIFQTRKLTWIGKATLLHTIAANKIIYHARTFPATTDETKLLEKTFFNFFWKPEKIESISRSTLVAEYETGGLQVPHIFSKIWTSQLKKIKILHDLETPLEFWQQHLLYLLGTKVKTINPILCNNRRPHCSKKHLHIDHLLKLYIQFNWNAETWKESDHRTIYKKHFPNGKPKYTPKQEKK